MSSARSQHSQPDEHRGVRAALGKDDTGDDRFAIDHDLDGELRKVAPTRGDLSP